MFSKMFVEDISSPEFVCRVIKYSKLVEINLDEAFKNLIDLELDELLYDI